MKKTVRKQAIFAMCLLATGLAWADDEGEAEDQTASQVDLRVSVIENIDVTSDKAPSPDADELTPEIAALLEEVDAVEENVEQE